MNTKFLTTFLVSLFFVLNSNVIFPQQKKGVVSKKPSTSKLLTVSTELPKKFADTEFQTNVDKLSPNFQGHSLKFIYDALETREKIREKGEF